MISQKSDLIVVCGKYIVGDIERLGILCKAFWKVAGELVYDKLFNTSDDKIGLLDNCYTEDRLTKKMFGNI
jgi:hypothetical protein